MYSAYVSQQMLIEGAAAVGIGAMLNKKVDVSGRRVVSIVSGRSIDTDIYLQIMQEQQKSRSSIMIRILSEKENQKTGTTRS